MHTYNKLLDSITWWTQEMSLSERLGAAMHMSTLVYEYTAAALLYER